MKKARNIARAAALIAMAGVAALAGASAQMASAQTATDKALLQPHPSKDWLTYSGDFSSQRYSLLNQINTGNARKLQVKWIYHIPDAVFGQYGQESVPIVVNGIMYLGFNGRVDAIDGRTGNVLWRYSRPAAGYAHGTAYYDGKVYTATADAHLIALDAATGAVLWDTKSDFDLSQAAPFVARGKVIVAGKRVTGSVQAFDAESGKHLWTWESLPKKGEPGFDTWAGGLRARFVWMSGAYDPQLNLYYIGTGQPDPTGISEKHLGDNLYADCIVAIDLDTGKLKWYFQTTPHDTHDWDLMEMPVLIDANVKGKPRKLLVQANRNGFYYVLDRTTGEFINGVPVVNKVDWATGLDSKGRPNVVPGHDPTVEGASTCPSTQGATNWPSPTYSPVTHLYYVTVAEGCGLNFRTASTLDLGGGGGYQESSKEPWQAFVYALDPVTGKRVWQYQEVRSNHYGPGLVSTAGGLVIAPEQYGQITALDAKGGKPLWHLNTGDFIASAPSVYEADGKEYIAITSNTNVIAFGLPDDEMPVKGGKP